MSYNGFIKQQLAGPVYSDDRVIMDLSAKEKLLLPCSVERKSPFEVHSLKKLCLSHLHKNLHIQTKSGHQIWKNFTISKWVYRNIPLPVTLQQELDSLLDNCVRHKGGYFHTTEVREKGVQQIYIKQRSPLYYRFRKDSIFMEEIYKYHFRTQIWYIIRSNYSLEEVENVILKEVAESIGFQRNWQ